jgi:hypothetical protein
MWRFRLTRIGRQPNCFGPSKVIAVMTLWTSIERVVVERRVPPSFEASYMDMLDTRSTMSVSNRWKGQTDANGTPTQTRSNKPSQRLVFTLEADTTLFLLLGGWFLVCFDWLWHGSTSRTAAVKHC